MSDKNFEKEWAWLLKMEKKIENFEGMGKYRNDINNGNRLGPLEPGSSLRVNLSLSFLLAQKKFGPITSAIMKEIENTEAFALHKARAKNIMRQRFEDEGYSFSNSKYDVNEATLITIVPVSYTHLTLPTICSV